MTTAAGGLRQLTLTNSTRAAGWIKDLAERGDIVLDPPYQRGVVWGVRRRRNFIRSILSGIPTGVVIINDRFGAHFTEGDWQTDPAYAVIDGKQRLTTLVDFFSGRLDVPADWFPADDVLVVTDGLVRYDGVARRVQRAFDNNHYHIAVSEAQVRTTAEEAEIFQLVNFGGLAQGEVDDDIPEG